MVPVLQQERGRSWGWFGEAGVEGEAQRLEERGETVVWDRGGLSATNDLSSLHPVMHVCEVAVCKGAAYSPQARNHAEILELNSIPPVPALAGSRHCPSAPSPAPAAELCVPCTSSKKKTIPSSTGVRR